VVAAADVREFPLTVPPAGCETATLITGNGRARMTRRFAGLPLGLAYQMLFVFRAQKWIPW
jgi:hypothetical protein